MIDIKRLLSIEMLVIITISLFSGCNSTDQSPTISNNSKLNSPSIPSTPAPVQGTETPAAKGPLSAIWANDGGDKITRDELRATHTGGASVINSVWNGSKVSIFGAKNEIVSFNLVLESAAKATSNLKISFDLLTGPESFTIRSMPATGNEVFDWSRRDIELFTVKYLQIKGLSRLSYETYDERHVPARFRRPFTGAGFASGKWSDRPDHDKFYPDIAVPAEATSNQIQIAYNENQSVWVDVYIPKKAPAGLYVGKVTLSQGSNNLYEIPVELEVKSFTLPDVPTSKTMVNFGYADIANRYAGVKFPTPGTTADTTIKRVRDRHFQLAHRHKISLIDSDPGSSAAPIDHPRDEWLSRLNGSLFTVEKGYRGPGTGSGNGIFSIGTYGTWGWKTGVTQASMWSHSDSWVNWFQTNSPQTEYFLYLIDESTNYSQMQQWAQWLSENPNAGKNLKSLATIPLPLATEKVPALSIATSWFTVGATKAWDDAATQAHAANPPKKVFAYNGKRPGNGSFATEDDGIALRELPWAQYKKGIDRWYFWESTYYNDYQGSRGDTNVFQTAQTFGATPTPDPIVGETGWNRSNGDGLLFYPGTDRVFPAESLGLEGPLASLRLKHWRRGIQDVDYIALAAAADPTATRAIVNRMVPKALWDYGIDDPNDPTWVRTDISWSNDPTDWENARKDLSNIIERAPTARSSVIDGKPVTTSNTPLKFSSKPGIVEKASRVFSSIKSKLKAQPKPKAN